MPDPTIFTAPVPRKAKVIHARIEFDDIANIYPTDIAIAAGMKETLIAIEESVKSLATEDRLKKIREERLSITKGINKKFETKKEKDAKANWNSSPVSWERASYEINKELDENGIVISELDTFTPFEWMNLAPNKRSLIGGTTGFALGWGIGASLGAKIGQPDSQVTCLVGDGAMLFGQIESLWSASRYDIPVTVIVFNNLSYDGERNRIYLNSPLIRNKETRDLWKDVSCYLGNPIVDYVGLANSFDIKASQANTPEELSKSLKKANRTTRDGRPYLIDLRIMQLDVANKPTTQTWHPDISIAEKRKIKV